MSIANEIERIQSAKSDLKDSLNAKNDAQHQITDDYLLDEYYYFVDSIKQEAGGRTPEWLNDGNTHLWIYLYEDQLDPYIGFLNVGNSVDIDWGDGTSDTVPKSTSSADEHYTHHHYENPGFYRIDIKNSFKLTGRSTSAIYQTLIRAGVAGLDAYRENYHNVLQYFEKGINCTFSDYYSLYNMRGLIEAMLYGEDTCGLSSNPLYGAFGNCVNLRKITLPQGIKTIGQEAFTGCTSLSEIVNMDEVTKINGSGIASSSFKTFKIPATMVSLKMRSLSLAQCEYFDFKEIGIASSGTALTLTFAEKNIFYNTAASSKIVFASPLHSYIASQQTNLSSYVSRIYGHVDLNGTYNLTITPTGTVTVSSSNPSICNVSYANNIVTFSGISEGTADITVTNNGVATVYKVIVEV